MDPVNGKSQAGGSGKIVPLLLVVNSLLLAGVLALLLLRESPAPADGAPAQATSEAAADGALAPGATGPIVRLPDFVIHLRNPEADRYLRLVLEIELGKDSDRELVTTNLPRIRDAFIAHLSDRSLEEISGTEGMDRLRKSLLLLLGDFLPRSSTRAIYITEFMVQ